ncbi:MAG: hypothetical protein AABY93_11215 [Bacteroidota bacterium]
MHIKNDNGSAPNPFWGTCTLTICKPKIRRTAKVGDWIIGTGSKNSKLKDGNTYDLSGSLVYAMKVSDKKTIKEYDKYCQSDLPNKLPKWFNKDWRRKLGDCIYDYSKGEEPTIRMAVHRERNRIKDLSGLKALLSNHFYYFGEEPRPIPPSLKRMVIKGQGHLVFDDPKLIETFEKWIVKFKKNKICANPQRKFMFEVSQSKDCMGNREPVKEKKQKKDNC